jgi:hypothetical protein
MKTVGAPGAIVAAMPLFPVWKRLKGVAHTLPCDLTIRWPFQQGTPLPEGYYAEVKPETLVAGQTHMVRAKPLTPVLLDHFGLA